MILQLIPIHTFTYECRLQEHFELPEPSQTVGHMSHPN